MCLAPPGKTIVTSRAMIGANDLRVDVLNDADALALLRSNGVKIEGQEAAAARWRRGWATWRWRSTSRRDVW